MAKSRQSRKLTKLTFALVLGGAVTAAIASQTGLGGSGRAHIARSSVSALARSARAGDALPAQVLAYPFAEHNFAGRNGAGSRLLRSDGSLQVYAVPGKAGMVCLVEVDVAAQTAGGACADRRVLVTGSIFTAARQDDGSAQVVGLVGDGATSVEADGKQNRVENNAYVLRGIEGKEITIGSPGASATIDIGD